MVSGVDSSRPMGPHSVPQKIADMMSASGVTPVDSPNSSGSTIWPMTMVAGDDPAEHQERLQPSRHDGEGDHGGQHGAQRRADIGTKRSPPASNPHRTAFGMPSANSRRRPAMAKPKLVSSCSDRTRATRLAASPMASGRRVHVAGAEQPRRTGR